MYKTLLLSVLLLSCSSIFAQPPTYRPGGEKRILVISGGGARGAWGGGLSKTLMQQYNYNFQYVIGNSTGSLLAPLVLIEEFDRLEEAYTDITQKDIFKGKSPFYTSGRKKGQLRIGSAALKVLFGNTTLGNSSDLKKTIKKFFTPEFYSRIRRHPEGKAFISTVLNFTLDQIEYKSSDDFSYDQTVDWMWASANQPVFMSFFEDRSTGYTYVDGGSKENVPILKALEIANHEGIHYIDVIVHNTEKPQIKEEGNLKILSTLLRTIDILTNDVKENDIFWPKVLNGIEIESGMMNSMTPDKSIEITIYFMSDREVAEIPNVLLFEKDRMRNLWNAGEQFFERLDAENYKVNYKIPYSIPFLEEIKKRQVVVGN